MPKSMILDNVYLQSIKGEKGSLLLLNIQIIGFLSINLNRIEWTSTRFNL